jgi:hypothetical protein
MRADAWPDAIEDRGGSTVRYRGLKLRLNKRSDCCYPLQTHKSVLHRIRKTRSATAVRNLSHRRFINCERFFALAFLQYDAEFRVAPTTLCKSAPYF